MPKKLTKEEFILKAKKVHGNKYDYSKVEYTNNSTKICIICPEHGVFYQTPHAHLSGQGCNKCNGGVKKDKFYFIEKARKIHGDKYDYSKVEYVNNSTKVCIICPEHGEFWQTPNSHLNKNGCPSCKSDKIREKKLGDIHNFIKKAEKIHNQKYVYNSTEYKTAKTPLKILCPIHGEFWQTPDKHLYGRGCPKCGNVISRAENEIVNYLQQQLTLNVIQREREKIKPYELDIYIPEKKIAIEYDGLLWHSEKYNIDKNYHLMKTELCEKQGIRLIHIFEDEWLEHKEIVKSKLKHILGYDKDLPKIFARKTFVERISCKEAMSFFNVNHIQGFSKSTIYLGCFYNNIIIGAMSFKKESNLSNKWELTRFATDITKHCVGVGGKLFKYFIENYSPLEIKSFADRRWSTILGETLYDKLGFKINKILNPDYYYYYNRKRMHKFNFRKEKILKNIKSDINETMTEHEMCLKNRIYRIYNCGLIRYKWVCN